MTSTLYNNCASTSKTETSLKLAKLINKYLYAKYDSKHVPALCDEFWLSIIFITTDINECTINNECFLIDRKKSL